ncbi:MAG: bifunctional DNA-formamidopyrimidine glycosylase/DNA-(apurinic or apyrimidinic site) lyase [Pirellulales bacterium]
MPELPEVETMRRGIAAIAGGRVTEVERLRCPRKLILISPRIDSCRRRIVGRRISSVDRAGKRVVLRFDTGDALVIEPRMTGLVLVANPPDPLYLRLRLAVEGSQLREFYYWDRRGLGCVRLFSSDEFDAAFGPEKLGPDALVMTAELYRERLGGSRREIKVALLDQRAVAGIGNLYASEILHVAGVHPAVRCSSLSRKRWAAIAEAAHLVLCDAIEHEGSTLGDGTYRNALNESGGYQNHHRVYDRAGKACPRCSSEIVRSVQAQRSTFYCPTCQNRR